MREYSHRSENLTIAVSDDGRKLEVEIRFSTSSARGLSDAVCPRCGATGRPTHWELEGPDGGGNTIWMSCNSATCVASGTPHWSRPVVFAEGWVDR